MKHPIAVAFGIAVAVSLVLAGIALTQFRTDEKPFALAAVVLLFPFLWFFLWLITNGVSWWKDTTRR